MILFFVKLQSGQKGVLLKLFTYLLPKIPKNLSLSYHNLSFYFSIFPVATLSSTITWWLQCKLIWDEVEAYVILQQLKELSQALLPLAEYTLLFEICPLPFGWRCNESLWNSYCCSFWLKKVRELEKLMPVTSFFNPVSKGFDFCSALKFLIFFFEMGTK